MDKRSFQTGARVLREEGLIPFTRKSLNYFHRLFSYPYTYFKLCVSKPRYPSSLDYSFSSQLLKPAQIKSEIKELLDLLEKEKPKVMLEVGTGKGGTLFLFSSVLPKDAEIITLDQRGRDFGAGYAYWMKPLLKSYRQGKQKLSLVMSDSHDKNTPKKIKEILKNKELDFLFIDADHSYNGVKRDFNLYSPLVKKGGTIALHDVTATDVEGCDVYKFWNELKKGRKHKEFKGKERAYGIGVIEKD